MKRMESQLLPGARQQLDRFCRQYLQVQLDLDYPDEEHLRNDAFQESLHARLFEDHALKHAPPARYQLRVLKELTRRIEHSIQDWEEEVCHFFARQPYVVHIIHILTSICLSGHL
jgi:ATP:corrinoid adenosyltransferase